MGEVYFYHLTETPLEGALPMILGRARERGWLIEVRGRDAARIEALDLALWAKPDDGFLPHGIAGGPHDADQPILLTTAAASPARACVMSVDGADVSADEVAQAERACILFDGADGAALSRARDQWKALTSDGCAAQYWAQDGGRWTKKAETQKG